MMAVQLYFSGTAEYPINHLVEHVPHAEEER